MCDEELSKPLLELENMIGFQGSVPQGLLVHRDGEHLIYPVGCTVAIENLLTGTQEFLKGGSHNVSCVSVSKSGKYVSAGQTTHRGFSAESIVWTYEDKSIYSRMSLHKNAVQALSFSPNDKYLISLGGPDDGSIVVWSIAKKEAICGASAQPLSGGLTCMITHANLDDNVFISAGKGNLRIWNIDLEKRKIMPTDVRTGQTKRIVNCIKVSQDDKYFLCGTTSGDILVVNMINNNFKLLSPEKERFQMGISSLLLLESGEVVVGSGDGMVAVLKGVNGKLKKTGRCSELLVTCSLEDIKLWSTKKGRELLRICVSNKTCNAIAVMRDGKTLISGWDDGCIRAYYPESGNLMYTMDNAYGGSVTALAAFSTGTHIISGSNFGHVVIWDVPYLNSRSKKPVHVYNHFLLKEHKAEVTCIKIKANDSECITSSIDGSCIFWDLNLRCRRQMIRVNTLFKQVVYHPQEHQVLTTGTDRKIGYWETYDASMIRLLEGSLSGSVNSLDVSENGKYFVSGGDDKLLKVWLYEDGEMTHIGIGHSASITGIKISPNQKHIFSTSADGAILKWTFPFK